jgi:hypothetical protein
MKDPQRDFHIISGEDLHELGRLSYHTHCAMGNVTGVGSFRLLVTKRSRCGMPAQEPNASPFLLMESFLDVSFILTDSIWSRVVQMGCIGCD